MVVIKDMQMPKCCIHCPVFDGEYGLCNMTGEQETGMAAEERPDNCPLVPVVTCKDCKYWNRKEEYCKKLSSTMGYLEDECYLVCTDPDFFCADGQRGE